MVEPVSWGGWYCSCGTYNSGGSSCRNCGNAGSGAGGGAGLMLVMVGWVALVFSMPVYPFAGGAVILAMLAVIFGGDLVGLDQSPFLLLILIVAPFAGFFFGYKLERRFSVFAPYRLIRDIIRIAAGIAIIVVLINQEGPNALPPAQMLGVIVFFPIALWIIKRIDRLLKLDKPEHDPTSPKYAPKEAPAWLQTLMEKTNFGVAFSLGVMAGLLGMILGRESGILFGLFTFVVVTGAVMLLGGGLALIRGINIGLGGMPLRLLIGAGAGAAIGNWGGRGANQTSTAPEDIIFGTVIGVIVAIVWGLIANRKKRAG